MKETTNNHIDTMHNKPGLNRDFSFSLIVIHIQYLEFIYNSFSLKL